MKKIKGIQNYKDFRIRKDIAGEEKPQPESLMFMLLVPAREKKSSAQTKSKGE